MISEKLKKVILQTLKLKDFDLQDETLAHTVPGWDSLNHMMLIAEVENAYHVNFKMEEVLKLANVGDLQKLVDSKTADSPQK